MSVVGRNGPPPCHPLLCVPAGLGLSLAYVRRPGAPELRGKGREEAERPPALHWDNKCPWYCRGSRAHPDLADSEGERPSAGLGLILSQWFLEDMSLSLGVLSSLCPSHTQTKLLQNPS